MEKKSRDLSFFVMMNVLLPRNLCYGNGSSSWSIPESMGSEQAEQLEKKKKGPNANYESMVIAIDDSALKPVVSGDSGEGWPYAPVDWPHPGDTWSWKVGRRSAAGGYYIDRYLYPPKRFRNSRQPFFGSRGAVEAFLRSHFPGVDINAFFASFSWKIPVKLSSSQEAEAFPRLFLPSDNLPKDKVEVEQVKEERKSGSSASGRKRKKLEGVVASSPGPITRRSSRRSANRAVTAADAVAAEEMQIISIPDNFDAYLDSLDDILSKPLSGTPGSQSKAAISVAAKEEEMAEARTRLSSMLVSDFSSLVSSEKISELVSLASKLKNYSGLAAEKVVKLKLIEEIPLYSEVFIESRKMIQKVDRFFETLEANKLKAASLKKEYNLWKERADQLQSQIDSNLLTVSEIDDQIASLRSQRAGLIDAVDVSRSAKAEMTSTQQNVACEIPAVVHEIQLANSRVPEWEMNKADAQKHEAEILQKFASLEGFSL